MDAASSVLNPFGHDLPMQQRWIDGIARPLRQRPRQLREPHFDRAAEVELIGGGELLRSDFAGMIPALPQGLDALDTDLEADSWQRSTNLDRQGQAYVTEADNGDARAAWCNAGNRRLGEPVLLIAGLSAWRGWPRLLPATPGSRP